MTSKFVRGKTAKPKEAAPAPAAQEMPSAAPTSSAASLDRIKSVAAQFRNYINAEYHANVSYTPDADKVASISVSRWLPISEPINNALGMPGLPFGIITQAYGKKDSGKTTFLMEAIAACQREGILPILVLSEFKFDFNRLPKWMGADPEAMIVYPADDLESGFRFVEKILRGIASGKLTYPQPNPDYDSKKKTTPENMPDIEKTVDIGDMPCFLFWDSIGGTLSQNEAEGEVEDWAKDMGRGAQAAKRLVKRSASLLNKVRDRVGVLFLNQAWTARTPTGISYDMPTCGEAVQHYYGLEIHMKRRKEIFMTIQKQDVGIGFEIEFNVKKNHITHARPQTNLIAVAEGLLYPAELEEFKKRFRKVERLAENA